MQERRTIYCRGDHLYVDKRSGTQVKGLVLDRNMESFHRNRREGRGCGPRCK